MFFPTRQFNPKPVSNFSATMGRRSLFTRLNLPLQLLNTMFYLFDKLSMTISIKLNHDAFGVMTWLVLFRKVHYRRDRLYSFFMEICLSSGSEICSRTCYGNFENLCSKIHFLKALGTPTSTKRSNEPPPISGEKLLPYSIAKRTYRITERRLPNALSNKLFILYSSNVFLGTMHRRTTVYPLKMGGLKLAF